MQLSHLLGTEEHAHYESRQQLPQVDDGSHHPKPLAAPDLRRMLDLEEEAFFDSCRDTRPTTLMVGNISWKLSAGQVREHLHKLGFEDAYNFFHLPFFRTGHSNQGYFFINCKDPDIAERLKARLQGQAFAGCAKLCVVGVAEWQGLQELHAHFDRQQLKPKRRGAIPLFL